MSTSAVIEVTDLVVSRGGRRVLPGLNLSLGTGEVVGLLGPSGCGKSTLIRSLAGVQVIESGTVTVLGTSAGSAQNRSRIAYVTQASSVYPDLTVEENLRYFGTIYDKSAKVVDDAIATVALEGNRRQLTGSLSGGQRARVSLAAALIAEADLYLLDEPTVGLDPVLRQELWRLFRTLAATGATLLISSHVMDEASRCDRVLLMRSGQLIADDSPAGLLAATGTDTMENAFLAVADEAGASE